MELIAFLIIIYLGVSPDAVSHALTRGGAGAVRGVTRRAAASKRAAKSGAGAAGGAAATPPGRRGHAPRGTADAAPAATDKASGSAWDAAVAGWRTGVTDARQRRAEGRDAWSKARNAARPAAQWAATQAGTAFGWATGKKASTATGQARGWTLYRSPAMAAAGAGLAGGVTALRSWMTTPTTPTTQTPAPTAPAVEPTPAPATPTTETPGDINAGHVTLTSLTDPAPQGASADQTSLPTTSTPALDAPAPTTPVTHQAAPTDPDAPTPLAWPGHGGYLAVTATTAAATAIATTTAHAKDTTMELAHAGGHGLAHGAGGELATLTAIDSEAHAMYAAMQSLQEALAYMGAWGASLHERWTASQWGTSDLDQGVSATADATSALASISPEGVMAGLQQVMDGVRQAQGLAEQAASQQAYGDVTAFRE